MTAPRDHPVSAPTAAPVTAVETLILTGSDVARWLSAAECREAVERAFARLGEGLATTPKSLGFETGRGTFHVKATVHDCGQPFFAAKINGNFPSNSATRGLPTIQGVLVLADGHDGRPLCIMDSASVTAARTAATSAVAVRHLARPDAAVVAIIGCGLQGAAHLEALQALRPFEAVQLYDVDAARARDLAATATGSAEVRVMARLRDAVATAGIVVTCTAGGAFVLGKDDLEPGAFVAAVGADNPGKREIHPALMRRARVIVDDLAACAAGGDLHHALASGVMTTDDVAGDLAAVVAGRMPGRTRDDEIVVFDSTGIALEDAAAAEVVYRRAIAAGAGTRVRLSA